MMDFGGEISTPDIISCLVENNQNHSANSLLFNGAGLPEVKFTSRHSENGKEEKVDLFTFEFKVDITDTNIDPTDMLTPGSQLDLLCGEYTIKGSDAQLGQEPIKVFPGDGKGRRKRTGGRVNLVNLSPNVHDKVVVIWDSKSISVIINGAFRGTLGGPNIIDLSEQEQKGNVTGACDFQLWIGPYVWSGTMSYSGRADQNSWQVKSTSLSPLG